MTIGTGGLRHVSTSDLKGLLRALHRGEIACPLEANGLTGIGLFRLIDQLSLLHGLDKNAVSAVLVAVLSERIRS